MEGRAMKHRIVDRIAADGPLRFDDYMEVCLYDAEEGFFGSGRGAPGKDQDFLTSPEVSALFGSLVGRWAQGTEGSVVRPLVEAGAGSGAMLGPLVESWQGPVYAVERSEPSRVALAESYPGASVVASLDDVPSGEGTVIVANEVLDNVPAALARRTADGWVEIGVGEVAGDLLPVDLAARPEVEAWCGRWFPAADPGTVVAAQLRACSWVEDILERFHPASLCLIDYAARADELAARDPGSVVRTYRGHRSDLDILGDPGSTDLTVDVNVDAIVDAAERRGATVEVLSQASFLERHGARDVIADLRRDEHLAATEARTMDQLVLRSHRLDLEAVMDPDAFGGFVVFLIETGTR
jgi:SAM-dependent MidA family methyltransferase